MQKELKILLIHIFIRKLIDMLNFFSKFFILPSLQCSQLTESSLKIKCKCNI